MTGLNIIRVFLYMVLGALLAVGGIAVQHKPLHFMLILFTVVVIDLSNVFRK